MKIRVLLAFLVCTSLQAQGLLFPPTPQGALTTSTGEAWIGDVDQDGHPDFVIGADLYRGDGSGNFTPRAVRAPGLLWNGIAGGVVAAPDLDGDGDLDLVYFDGIWINQGGTYVDETAARIGSALSPNAAIDLVYDVDGDGDFDLLAWVVNGSSYRQLYLETVFNDGAGNFSNTDTRYLGGGSSVTLDGVVAGDFDGDGRQDLAFSGSWWDIGNGGTFGGVYPSSGRTRLPGSQIVAGRELRAAADFDGDGRDDLVLQTGGTFVLLGGVTSLWISPAYGHAYTVDFDGDGDLDCVARPVGGGAFDLALNDGNASFTRVPLPIGAQPLYHEQFAFGDVDRDGDSDVVLSNPPRLLRGARQQLDAPSVATLSSTVTFTVHANDESGPLSGLAQVALSPATGALALEPLGTLLLDPGLLIFFPPVTITAGWGSTTLPIPGARNLLGLEIFAQSVIADTSRRFRFSNRTRTVIQ